MLPFLLSSASAAQASTQLSRRLAVSKRRQVLPARRHTSTVTSYASHTARNDQDVEDGNDQPRTQHHRADSATFSHFFDRQTSIPQTASLYSQPKASYEIAAASRQAIADFRQAISTREPNQIIAAYRNLIRAHQVHAEDVFNSSSRAMKLSDIGFPVRKADIQTAIRYLVQHAQRVGAMETRYVEACQQMFQDMSQVFGFRIGPMDLHRQLQACLLAESSCIDPCSAFRQLRAKYPDWQTTSIEWNMVISYLVRRDLHGQAIEVYEEMLDFGVEPEASLRNTMIRVNLAVGNVKDAEAHLEHMKQEQRQLGLDTLTTTVEGLCKLVSTGKVKDTDPMMAKLRTYASELRKAVEALPAGTRDSSSWRTLLRYEAIVLGPAHALETARQTSRSGVADFRTLNMLLRAHVEELKELQSSDEALELLDRVQSAIDPQRRIRPDDNCYNILMLGLLDNSGGESALLEEDVDLSPDDGTNGSTVRQPRSHPTPNQVREAQLFYDHIRSLGIPPTPLLVTPLLRAYCEAFLPSLPSAMKLLQDMLEYRSSSTISSSRKSGSSRRKATLPFTIGIKIIQPILDACVRLRDISSARNFLSRLFDAGVSISAAHKTELMRTLMGITNSWTEAFHVYRVLHRFPTANSSNSSTSMSGLDERGYVTLLESFRKLAFRSFSTNSASLVAPPEHLLSILTDMRLSGYRPSSYIYTSILDYYSKTPTPSYLGVKATHEALKADTALEPDLPLINALMNAYNRAEEPAMVFAIWDSLLATRQDIDGVTLSVVFDTCGRFGLLSVARKALATIRRSEEEGGRRGRSVMTKGAWDSWLECLARCGRLEEAIELVFGEMRRSLFRQAITLNELSIEEGTELTASDLVVRSTQAPIRDRRGEVVGPDSKTLSTLLKFAARERDRRQRRHTTSSAGGNSIWHTLRSRIREELSWLYPQVKGIGETPVV